MVSIRVSDWVPGRTTSITLAWGMAKRSPATPTMSAETIARVSGILMRKRLPWPNTLCSSIRPPICSMLVLTTSMPTPRPDTEVTAAAVEKPGWKMKRRISSSLMRSIWARVESPWAIALSAMRRTSMPRPSSSISITTWPPSCRALRVMVPVGGLPAR